MTQLPERPDDASVPVEPVRPAGPTIRRGGVRYGAGRAASGRGRVLTLAVTMGIVLASVAISLNGFIVPTADDGDRSALPASGAPSTASAASGRLGSPLSGGAPEATASTSPSATSASPSVATSPSANASSSAPATRTARPASPLPALLTYDGTLSVTMTFGAPSWNGSWIVYPVRIVIVPQGAGVGRSYYWGGNLGLEPGQAGGSEPTGRPTDTTVALHWFCDRDYYGSGSGHLPIVVDLGVHFLELANEAHLKGVNDFGVRVQHTVDLEADCAAIGQPMAPTPNPYAPPPCIVTAPPSAAPNPSPSTDVPEPPEITPSPPPC